MFRMRGCWVGWGWFPRGVPRGDGRGVDVGMTNVPNAWLLDWVRLFSQRIPAGERPEGTVAGSVLLKSTRKGQPARWDGEFRGEIIGLLPWTGAEGAYLVHPV